VDYEKQEEIFDILEKLNEAQVQMEIQTQLMMKEKEFANTNARLTHMQVVSAYLLEAVEFVHTLKNRAEMGLI